MNKESKYGWISKENYEKALKLHEQEITKQIFREVEIYLSNLKIAFYYDKEWDRITNKFLKP